MKFKVGFLTFLLVYPNKKEILVTAEMPPSTVGEVTRRGCNPKSLSKDLDILNLKNKNKKLSFGGDS